jgi:hypothetical protein
VATRTAAHTTILLHTEYGSSSYAERPESVGAVLGA